MFSPAADFDYSQNDIQELERLIKKFIINKEQTYTHGWFGRTIDSNDYTKFKELSKVEQYKDYVVKNRNRIFVNDAGNSMIDDHQTQSYLNNLNPKWRTVQTAGKKTKIKKRSKKQTSKRIKK